MSFSPSTPTPTQLRALARFPKVIQDAHASYLATGDAEAADQVLLAVLHEHLPSAAKTLAPATLQDDQRLIEDLGFDSLAVAEVVFFLEDLYGVKIAQEHLMKLQRVGDLRCYLRSQLQVKV